MFIKSKKTESLKPDESSVTFEVRMASEARKKYEIDESLLTISGDMVFADFLAARVLTDKINSNRNLLLHPETALDASEVNAVSLINEIMHTAIDSYCLDTNPSLFGNLEQFLSDKLGEQEVKGLLELYTEKFPPSDRIYLGEDDPRDYVEGTTGDTPHRHLLLEDLLISWIDNQNPAADRLKELFDDSPLLGASAYEEAFELMPAFFSQEPSHATTHRPLFDMLLEPVRKHPASLSEQLEFMQREWGDTIRSMLSRVLGSLDFIREEQRIRFDPGVFGPGPTVAPTFDGEVHEPEQFSDDLDWMPNVVLIAKNAAVWLDQLSRHYNQEIRVLNDIPDDALDELASRGFNALWLIGIWQRSQASRHIKQMTGNPDAAASAYSLTAYRVGDDLGGPDSLAALKARTSARGIRLACDMVPNHMGLDSDWVCEHPDWFVQRETPPFPSYSFTGPDLSGDPRVQVYLEDGYWNRSDAAVVFKRVDPHSGDERFVYHGNDGTHLPWNDTAQLNYLLPEVREAVTRQIIDIAKQFPIIRFDAAMTLAKKHFHRLWFPEPGSGGDIASRAEYGMTDRDFDAAFPTEFWRDVVDRVQEEAPDTLLLAEAFWMMEGYFVRTLGMHRVYNSAFMNMLKNEENAKYRDAIRSVLEFQPQILKRYVNFMSNPDEETAIAQFGSDDKYFGCCILMSTMPGTPMFGHGQVEGFGEKYGMEYQRAYHEESPNRHLVERHQREIAPLLRKRYLFSGVEQFRLYDLILEDGGVDDDVFAYSNRVGYENCLVVYRNCFSETRGRIHVSVPFRGEDDDMRTCTLAEGLGIVGRKDTFLVFRDQITLTEHILHSEELVREGLPITLAAFKYQVFIGFREVTDSPEKPYSELADHLAGRGVPNVEVALDEWIHRRVIHALHDAIRPATLRALQCHTKPREAQTGFLNRLTSLASVIATAEGVSEPPAEIIEATAKCYAASIGLPLDALRQSPVSAALTKAIRQTTQTLAEWPNTYQLDGWRVLLILPFMKVMRHVYEQHDDPTLQNHFIRERFLDNVLRDVLEGIGAPHEPAERDIQLIHILTLIDKDLGVACNTSPAVYFEYLFSDKDVQRFTCVNRYEDQVYFNKERFEKLVNWLALLAVADCLGNGEFNAKQQELHIKALCEMAARSTEAAEDTGYRLMPFLKAI